MSCSSRSGPSLFLPGSLFALAGGALFGPIWGTILNLAVATLGATAGIPGCALSRGGLGSTQKPGGRLKRLVVGRRGGRLALRRLCPAGAAVSRSTCQLCARPDAHRSRALRPNIPHLHGTRHPRLYSWLGLRRASGASGDASAMRYGLMRLAVARCDRLRCHG